MTDGSNPSEGTGGGPPPVPSLWVLVRTYLKISLLGFGGPNAHLALMLDEVVERRRWISRERFLEIVALTNLLPGPNSSEVAIHVGYTQRGWAGALATGLTFLVPTFVIVTVLSALYFRFGTLPQVAPIFWALQPVIVAIVLSAGWKIGRAGVRTVAQGLLAGLGALVSLASGQAVIGAMVVGGAATWWLRKGERGGPSGGLGRGGRWGGERRAGGFVFLPATALGGVVAALGTLGSVFLTHLWIGSVLFGGGYVLVALLQPYAVVRYGWVTSAQFLDGVAITQAVPGPISTLSAFVGYAAAGVPGALLGTAGIYLPAFVGVLLVAPRLARLREVDAVRHALEGVVAVVAGAVVGVGASLAVAGVRDPAAALLAGTALVLALWKKVPAVWLVAGGLGVGALRVLLA